MGVQQGRMERQQSCFWCPWLPLVLLCFTWKRQRIEKCFNISFCSNRLNLSEAEAIPSDVTYFNLPKPDGDPCVHVIVGGWEHRPLIFVLSCQHCNHYYDPANCILRLSELSFYPVISSFSISFLRPNVTQS